MMVFVTCGLGISSDEGTVAAGIGVLLRSLVLVVVLLVSMVLVVVSQLMMIVLAVV